MAGALAHMPDNQLSAAALDAAQWSVSFGPITLSISFDPSVPQVTVSATLLGTQIGSVTLNPQNTSATIGGSVLGQKAEITLSVNFTTLVLNIDAVLDAFGIDKKWHKSITL